MVVALVVFVAVVTIISVVALIPAVALDLAVALVSGSDSGSGCGSSDSHTCACSCYYCGAYGCGAGSGCGCDELKNPIELMDSSKFVGFCTGVQCWDLCKEILDKYGISSYGGRTAVFRLVEEVSGSLANWGDSQNYQNAINSFLRLTG
ncbi:hypothetical protein [Bacteroides faecalis]|uniref:hypothetical protein n=1 Tax=Bacteroides faecalis TaxID=2447885 RepID=UPI000F61F732|nr:hypothetical protein [Bacteroides faecalis]